MTSRRGIRGLSCRLCKRQRQTAEVRSCRLSKSLQLFHPIVFTFKFPFLQKSLYIEEICQVESSTMSDQTTGRASVTPSARSDTILSPHHAKLCLTLKLPPSESEVKENFVLFSSLGHGDHFERLEEQLHLYEQIPTSGGPAQVVVKRVPPSMFFVQSCNDWMCKNEFRTSHLSVLYGSSQD